MQERKVVLTWESIYDITEITYRGYYIHKKLFLPSIIFYIILDNEVHILRVLREERDWEPILQNIEGYSYP